MLVNLKVSLFWLLSNLVFIAAVLFSLFTLSNSLESILCVFLQKQ
jgi:hypothetical protein